MKFILVATTFVLSLGLAASQAYATAPATARHYDCSKAGNANKAACRGATPATTPTMRPTVARAPAPARTPATRNYDCSKAGNANKAACRSNIPLAAARPVVAAKPASPAAHPQQPVHASGPQGATALCKDGTYSHAATHTGSCSHHGGVKQFY